MRPYFRSLPLQLKALGAITVVFPMMNILAQHRMLNFKALALVVWYSVEIVHI